MRTVGNVIWLVLAGWWLALGYAVAGVLAFVLIVTIPFGIACWKMAPLALLPLGSRVAPVESVQRDLHGAPWGTVRAAG